MRLPLLHVTAAAVTAAQRGVTLLRCSCMLSQHSLQNTAALPFAWLRFPERCCLYVASVAMPVMQLLLLLLLLLVTLLLTMNFVLKGSTGQSTCSGSGSTLQQTANQQILGDRNKQDSNTCRTDDMQRIST
jgi:hypothetical protein